MLDDWCKDRGKHKGEHKELVNCEQCGKEHTTGNSEHVPSRTGRTSFSIHIMSEYAHTNKSIAIPNSLHVKMTDWIGFTRFYCPCRYGWKSSTLIDTTVQLQQATRASLGGVEERHAATRKFFITSDLFDAVLICITYVTTYCSIAASAQNATVDGIYRANSRKCRFGGMSGAKKARHGSFSIENSVCRNSTSSPVNKSL